MLRFPVADLLNKACAFSSLSFLFRRFLFRERRVLLTSECLVVTVYSCRGEDGSTLEEKKTTSIQ